jgi:hypothetical protein
MKVEFSVDNDVAGTLYRVTENVNTYEEFKAMWDKMQVKCNEENNRPEETSFSYPDAYQVNGDMSTFRKWYVTAENS